MPEPTGSDIGSTAWLSRLIQEAENAGASEDQLATLRDYELSSAVPFEVVQEAVDRTFQCLDDNGIPYFSEVTVDDAGFQQVFYGHSAAPGLSDEESLQIATDCEFQESQFIQQLYQAQPGYIEAADRAFADAKPAILVCLRDNDVEIDDEATRSEIVAAVVALISSGPDPSTPGPDCLYLLPDIRY